MVNLEKIEKDLMDALKSKDQLSADTLRGLKVRLQNEKIAKMRDLTEEEAVALVKSEIKRRKEAAESFSNGGRAEMAEKELKEALVLEKFLPAQKSNEELEKIVQTVITENNFVASDFGKAMGLLKTKVGQSADGAVMAKLLKEKLK